MEIFCISPRKGIFQQDDPRPCPLNVLWCGIGERATTEKSSYVNFGVGRLSRVGRSGVAQEEPQWLTTR